MAKIRGKDLAVIKTEVPIEFKDRVNEFTKKSGESEANMVRKAVKNYIETERTVTLNVRKLT